MMTAYVKKKKQKQKQKQKNHQASFAQNYLRHLVARGFPFQVCSVGISSSAKIHKFNFRIWGSVVKSASRTSRRIRAISFP